MHFCKTKRHVWLQKEDAMKCCNGYKRELVMGDQIPEDAANVQVEEDTGVRFCRIWVKVEEVNPYLEEETHEHELEEG